MKMRYAWWKTSAKASRQDLTREKSEAMMQVISRNLDDLGRRHSNLVAITAGYKIKEGQETGVPAIRVYVLLKNYLPLGEERLAIEIEGFPTDVSQGFMFPAAAVNRERFGSVKLGASIGIKEEEGSGSLGAVLVREDSLGDDEHFILTCKHVIDPSEKDSGKKDWDIVHPSHDDVQKLRELAEQELNKKIVQLCSKLKAADTSAPHIVVRNVVRCNDTDVTDCMRLLSRNLLGGSQQGSHSEDRGMYTILREVNKRWAVGAMKQLFEEFQRQTSSEDSNSTDTSSEDSNSRDMMAEQVISFIEQTPLRLPHNWRDVKQHLEASTLNDEDKHLLRLWFLEHIDLDTLRPATDAAIKNLEEIQQRMQSDREKRTLVNMLKNWVQALQEILKELKKCKKQCNRASPEPRTIARYCGISLQGNVPVSRSDGQAAEFNTYVDAAIARLTDYPPSADFAVTPEEGEKITGNVMSFHEILELGGGTELFKCGRTTRMTHGTLIVPTFYAYTPGERQEEGGKGDPKRAGEPAVQVKYAARDSKKTLWKENLFAAKGTFDFDFTYKGDSGALVFNKRGDAVGLVCYIMEDDEYLGRHITFFCSVDVAIQELQKIATFEKLKLVH